MHAQGEGENGTQGHTSLPSSQHAVQPIRADVLLFATSHDLRRGANVLPLLLHTVKKDTVPILLFHSE